MAETPTIYGWGGGTVTFKRRLESFYDLVEEEGTLAPLFGALSPGSTVTTSLPDGSR